MRVIVCGGRKYGLSVEKGDVGEREAETLDDALDAIHRRTPITVIIQGGATGADSLARDWAESNHVKCVTVPADWATHKLAAGPIRNERMARDFSPDLVLAAPGGKGTTHMLSMARKYSIAIQRIKPVAV